MGLIARENMRSLYLDESTHTYTVDGHHVDGVTSPIKDAGFIQNSDSSYMDRGTIVHLVTQKFDEGTLDESTVDPTIKGYLDSWKRFREDQNYRPTKIELRLFDPIYLYAGTVDRLPLCDLKSGSEQKWHRWQLAAYWNLCRVNGLENQCTSPFSVYLQENGDPPKLRNYNLKEMREAFKDFACILQFVRLKRTL